MQTNFTPAGLADPRAKDSEGILRSCVHCGFCTATCPTYLLLGDELDSPRGRIYLIKDMLEEGKPATPEVVKHLDRCLSCLACMTTCPSGVHYQHLVDHARAHVEETYERPLDERALRGLLALVLPYRGRFRAALWLARLGRPLAPLVARLPRVGARLAAMLALAPPSLPPRTAALPGRVFPAEGARRARVALLTGCAQPVIAPSINEAAIRLLNRHGVEVVLPAGEGCCGALVHHMGREAQSVARARDMVDRWTREIEGEGLDAVLVTTSGCGTAVKDYGHVLRGEPAYAAKAERVARLAKDVTEFLATLDVAPVPGFAGRGMVVAYHSACSLQHGQGVKDEPARLLRRAGFVVKLPAEGHVCCGSAGTYNLLQPELAGRLRERKCGHLARTGAGVVAAGNVGCLTQIAKGFADAGSGAVTVHTCELLDWATGGPRPAALAGVADPAAALVAAE